LRFNVREIVLAQLVQVMPVTGMERRLVVMVGILVDWWIGGLVDW
jgi:hypothetical protein